MGKKRKTFSGKEKATIVLEALRERQTLSEIAQKYGVHPTQVSVWKKEAQEHLGDLFGDKRRRQQEDLEQGQLIERLYQQIGQLQVELNWLKKKLGSHDVSCLRGLIDPGADGLSLSRQCALLGLNRSSYYYTPVEESAFNLMLMRLMDEQYLKTPFYGVGQMTYFLRRQGHEVNPKRVRRLLRLMGLSAVCPGPHTSKPGKGEAHQVFPYLLGNLVIDRPGQVFGADITYIPLRYGFLYLVAFIDWYSRYVVSWELSNSLDAGFCIEALEAAHKTIVPEIVNTDQGAQFTSLGFVKAVLGSKSKLSMDGKGRAIDNIFTERFWRSLKYEDVYLKSYEGGVETWQGIRQYMHFYNYERPCSALNGASPADVFLGRVRVPVLDRTAKV